MRRRAKIRTNNSNSGKKGDEVYTSESISRFLSVVPFSSLHLSSLSLCLSLSVYQPFLTITNIFSHFPLNLQVYLGLFISVIPFSPVVLCQSISLSLSLSLPWPDFHSTLSTSNRNKEQHVFFVFYSSLWHHIIFKEYINISSPGI